MLNEWKVVKQKTVTNTFLIYGLRGDFLKNDEFFRSVRKDEEASCGLCSSRFEDGEYMTLALNKGIGGNLLICSDCREEAIEQGVSCTFKKNN